MKSILKQSSFLIFAQVFGRIIGFFYTIILARNLGVEDFGLLTSALVYFSLISAISDFGLNRFLIREIAADQTKSLDLVWNISMFRLMITSLIFAIAAIILYLLDPDKLRVGLILLSILAIYPLSVAQTFDAIFVAKQKLQFSSIALIISSFATFLIGVSLVTNGFGAIGAVNALIWGQIVYLITFLLILWRTKMSILSHVNLQTFKKIALESLPYGFLGVIGLVYFRIDTLLLSYLKGNFETGIYAIAYRFLEVVVFIPGSLGTALFPHFSKLHIENPHRIKSLLFKSLKVVGFVSLIIVLGYVLILPIIIYKFLPQFLLSLDAIKILSLAIPFMFLHVTISSLVLSTEKYLGKIILISLIPLTFNIFLNLIFIPQFGFIGASWVTVASDIFSFLLIFSFIKKYIL